jgi:hypothetical protein
VQSAHTFADFIIVYYVSIRHHHRQNALAVALPLLLQLQLNGWIYAML